MPGLDEIRKIALALPEVEEGPPVRAARRIAAFKVAGKSFVGVETGGRTMTVSLSQEEGEAISAGRPSAYDAILRNGRTFLGLRVDLEQLDEDQVRDLIERSWRHTAPKRLVEARG